VKPPLFVVGVGLLTAAGIVLSIASTDEPGTAADGATVGIDLNVAGNSATTLGGVENCLAVQPGSSLQIDTFVRDIPSAQDFIGFSYDISFSSGVSFAAQDHAYLLAASSGSVTDASDAVPNSLSPHTASAYTDTPAAGFAQGVLGRYTLTLAADASGLIDLGLQSAGLVDSSNHEIPQAGSPQGAALAVAPATCSPITPAPNPNDCRTFTPTPTVSPSPTPTPAWTPTYSVNICNDTGSAASDLHIVLTQEAGNVEPITQNVPGCSAPSHTYNPSPSGYTSVDVTWDLPCVDPGKYVSVYFVATCSTPQPGCSVPHVACFYWTLSGQPLASASPAVNPARCNIPTPTQSPSPGPCPPLGTPPFTYAPTATPASATPTPGPTSRDVVIITTIPFCNDAAQTASDLHIRFAFPYSGASVVGNAPGCPAPALDEPPGLDNFRLDLDWGVACVDSGESVSLELVYGCGDVPCTTPQPFCYTWTLFGEPLASGQGDCPSPTSTPTATPPVTGTPTTTPTPTPPTGPPTVTPAPPPLWGDIDCNNMINSADALALLRLVAGLFVPRPAHCAVAEDVDCNDVVNSVDALKLLRFSVGLSVTRTLPCPMIGA